jgi:carboxyl-terminal processing protease
MKPLILSFILLFLTGIFADAQQRSKSFSELTVPYPGLYSSGMASELFEQSIVSTGNQENSDKEYPDNPNVLFPVAPRTNRSIDNYYDNLFYLCKVWGYLKYYHSSLSDGNINWDKVLIDNLPILKNVSSKNEFNNYLSIFFNKVGGMQTPNSPPPIVTDDLKYNLKTDWFNNENFSITTTNFLLDIQDKFRPRDNYYVQKNYGAGNPTFDNDKQYSNVNNTTEEIRLLSLFRYWNVINYFFPHKYLLDKNWNDVLKEIIPKIINCIDEKSYHNTILELAACTNDAHAFTTSGIIERYIRGYGFLPIKLKYINGYTVISGVGKGISNLMCGDVIKKLNGIPVNELRSNLKSITIGSNPANYERNINTDLITFTDQSKPVELEIENARGTFNYSVPLMNSTNYLSSFDKNENAWTIKNIESKKFGIINMGLLQVSQLQTMFNELWDTDALIFDCRNYPNGTMLQLISYLFPAPIMVARFYLPDITYPGTFYWSADFKIGSGNFTKTYNKKIYILFNEESQSQAEYTIMALEQHPNAVKIGSQTAGADGNVSIISLPGGIIAYYTGYGVFYPDYCQTQRIGIIPGINVVPTIEGLRNEKDEVLEAAFNAFLNLTGIKDDKIINAEFSLSQNYPNPFNPSTVIKYQLPVAGYVTLKVYDLLGREVATLADEYKPAGSYHSQFSILNSQFSSGVYFYRLKAGDKVQTRKLVLIK